MIIDLTLPVSILALHFIADFVLQSDWMAINKSKNWYALTAHVLVYSATFTLFFGWVFGLLTFISHFITDAVTSRVSRMVFPWIPDIQNPKIYWDNEGIGMRSRHRFFSWIGFDQLIHYVTLALTLKYVV